MDLPSTDIVLFESHDAVRERYAQRHGREITTEKASEIVAFFSQGRQYFEAAGTSGALVAPLLFYYGVNALTRGAVLFLDAASRQATLKPSHGLSQCNWHSEFSQGLERLPNLQVRLEATGTFAEYTRASRNRSWILVRDLFTFKRLEVLGSDDIVADTRIDLRSIISRIPDLSDLYEQVMSESANVLSAEVRASSASAEVTVIGSRRFPPSESALRASVPELATAPASRDVSSGDPRPALTFTLSPDAAGSVELPPLRYACGATWLALPLTHQLNFSTVSVMYLFSFAIGTLARYYPREWLALLGGRRGDRMFPVIREGQRIVASHFASELAGELSA